ncbi:sugar phosphate isomerase/epimerase family protein [Microlunatus parietis]|uniref:Sugar phosphate isomerase/epimerase n=1 Tax=Microlunatus parietis TaxID=682979 RepID=A0A7Y9I8Y6_9ACTN|nr:TIM barrel protein [Microlunatus parietis]NYE72203.1 sugar phosphate isomerase/epimerase [Microlunatus parietis]
MTTTWTLSGFGDEIDPDPVVQVAVLQALGARHLEVRSAWGTNVVEFDDDQLSRLKTVLIEREMGVSAIASPIGKVEVAAPIENELARLDAAIKAAQTLDAGFIRIFSFYRAEGVAVEAIRDQVIDHLGALADRADRAGLVLVHENEKHIYGDIPARVHDVITAVDSPALRVAWDNANFVQCGVRPYTDGFELLHPYVAYLQVKDARAADGQVVPAGQGDGELAETVAGLRDHGFAGFASLEPHLTHAGQLGGFSGPAAFGTAARAFAHLAETQGVNLR